jgi:hypothetical protein
MTDEEVQKNMPDIIAGDKFRDTMIPKADGTLHGGPAWCGWVIMDAYLAGVKAERESILELGKRFAYDCCDDFKDAIRARGNP